MTRQELETLKARIVELKNIETSWNDVDALQYRLDELGKIVQTTEGNGTAFDPFKTWKPGTEVHVGEWWQTEDDYIWEAIKDGVPTSSTDREYWDVVDLPEETTEDEVTNNVETEE